MATPVNLPALGESVTEGTVTRWLKQPGDTVAADEPLLEVSTDKVDTEIPSPAGGVLLEIKVSEDETVDVGTELALIGDASEASGSGNGAGGGEQPAAEAAAPEPAAQEAGPQEPAEQASAQQTQPTPQNGGSGGGGTPVTLPALGESVTEGTVTRWLKSPGDQVQADEPLLEVSTDKVDTEVPSPATGVLLEIKVGEDETVDVGTELATIGPPSEQSTSTPSQVSGDEPASEQREQQRQEQQRQEQQRQEQQPAARDDHDGGLAAEASQHAEAEAQSEVKTAQASADAPQRQDTGPGPSATPDAAPAAMPKASSAASRGDGDASPYVTPLVRRLAAENGVDLAAVHGSGVGGRIRKQDVLAAAEQASAAPAAREEQAPEQQAEAGAQQQAPAAPTAHGAQVRGTTEKMSRLRKVIAQRMVESLLVSAQLTTVVEVDVTAISRLRSRAKAEFEAREGTKLSFLPFFAKATLEALTQHPKLNATVDTEKGEVTYLDAEHLGVAVDTDRGLLVPVIKDAGDLNIAGLARRIADLAERTRTNKITPDELSGGSFTLTNTGSRGALFDTPIINQPQVGILGTGAVVKRPVVVTDAAGADAIAVRQMIYLALTYDHRLVDGADAARFLTTIKQRLEQGSFEADLGL